MKLAGVPLWVWLVGGLVILKSGILGSSLSNVAGPFQGLVGGGTGSTSTPAQAS